MSQEERDFPEGSAADRPDKTGAIEVELCRAVPTRLSARPMGGTVHGDSLAFEVNAAVFKGQARRQPFAFYLRRNGERTFRACSTQLKLALIELIDHLAHECLIRPGQGSDRLLDLRRGRERGYGLRHGQERFLRHSRAADRQEPGQNDRTQEDGRPSSKENGVGPNLGMSRYSGWHVHGSVRPVTLGRRS